MAEPAHITEPVYANTDPTEITLKVLLRATETGGAVSLFEEITPPRQGPPLHVHYHEDEFFRVLQGRFRFQAGEQIIAAGPGDTLFVPRGTAHCFYNAGETPGRLFMGFAPGGGERFFDWINQNGFPKMDDLDQMAALKADFGIEFLGPNPFANT